LLSFKAPFNFTVVPESNLEFHFALMVDHIMAFVSLLDKVLASTHHPWIEFSEWPQTHLSIALSKDEVRIEDRLSDRTQD
jgi:hypothetical protein